MAQYEVIESGIEGLCEYLDRYKANTKQDVVEFIINNEIKDDKKKKTLLKAYKDTVAEGYPFNIENFIKRAGVKVAYIDLPDNMVIEWKNVSENINKKKGVIMSKKQQEKSNE